jgi:hypothetical protein
MVAMPFWPKDVPNTGKKRKQQRVGILFIDFFFIIKFLLVF